MTSLINTSLSRSVVGPKCRQTWGALSQIKMDLPLLTNGKKKKKKAEVAAINLQNSGPQTLKEDAIWQVAKNSETTMKSSELVYIELRESGK